VKAEWGTAAWWKGFMEKMSSLGEGQKRNRRRIGGNILYFIFSTTYGE